MILMVSSVCDMFYQEIYVPTTDLFVWNRDENSNTKVIICNQVWGKTRRKLLWLTLNNGDDNDGKQLQLGAGCRCKTMDAKLWWWRSWLKTDSQIRSLDRRSSKWQIVVFSHKSRAFELLFVTDKFSFILIIIIISIIMNF